LDERRRFSAPGRDLSFEPDIHRVRSFGQDGVADGIAQLLRREPPAPLAATATDKR